MFPLLTPPDIELPTGAVHVYVTPEEGAAFKLKVVLEQVIELAAVAVTPIGATVLNGAVTTACAVQPLTALAAINVYVPEPDPVVF